MSEEMVDREREVEVEVNAGATGTRSRRFRLFDLVLLIAAVAVGQRGSMAVQAIYSNTGISSPRQVVNDIRARGILAAPYHVVYWFEIGAPPLLAVTAGLFMSRRLRPRPTGAELARQPGGVAISSAFLSALAVFVAWGVVGYPLHRAGKLVAAGVLLNPLYPFLLTIMLLALVASGASVAAGWLGLALNGGTLRDPDWVEWAGRVLGIVLVLALPFTLWSSLLYH